MTNGFGSGWYPHYDLAARIQHTKLDTGTIGMYPARMERIEEPGVGDFKGVLSGLIENFNNLFRRCVGCYIKVFRFLV